ncbi:MAG TPA: hypothetical protein GX532_06550 [Clostridia bacterium]|jgi:hypothetical protein|nr:TadE/TadG family type IV pilus assembly protein [Clostridia bacterium]HHY06612.1 hypothetical protein [Clostridia bacterium]
MVRKWRKRNKGSLTVEACIALPVFLAFFYLLLFFTKIACINIVLDHAVKETARQLAAVSYPLRFFNEHLDLKIAEGDQLSSFLSQEAENIEAIGQDMLDKSFLESILTGQVQKLDLKKMWDEVKNQVKDDGYNLVEGALLEALLEPYLALKGAGQYYLAREILEQQLENSSLDLAKLNLTLVEFPQSSAEYQYKKDVLWYRDFALEPDVDFSKDDVVLQLEYQAVLPVPFLAVQEIQLCHLAVERAWLYGGNGLYAANRAEEGIDFTKYSKRSSGSKGEEENQEDEREYVYLCRSPTEVYHRFRDCKYIYDKTGVRKTSLEEAKERGLRAHAGCPELFK